MAPKGNLIARNICVGGRWGDFEDKAKPLVTFQDNLLDQDPHFVDPEHLNFQLKDDSPAYKLGFQRIPMEKIGFTGVRNALRGRFVTTSIPSAVKRLEQSALSDPTPLKDNPITNQKGKSMSFRMLPVLTFALITIGVLAADSRAAWELSTDDTHIVMDVENNAAVVKWLGVPGGAQLGCLSDGHSADAGAWR